MMVLLDRAAVLVAASSATGMSSMHFDDVKERIVVPLGRKSLANAFLVVSRTRGPDG